MKLKKAAIILLIILFQLAVLTGCVHQLFSESPPNEILEENEEKNLEEILPEQIEEEKEPEVIEETIPEVQFPINTVYIKGRKQNIRQEPFKDAKVTTALAKGQAVLLIGERKDDSGQSWSMIRFDDDEGQDKLGWLKTEDTVLDWMELMNERFKDMDYNPQEKIANYIDNPRVKVRGIYVTIYSAGGKRIDDLIEMTKRSGINTFVIDVKDDRGYMLFKTEAAEKFSPKANEHATVKDIKALMEKLKENNIYTIARIVSFKDPTYTAENTDKAIIYKDTRKPFTNNDGLIWASPHDRNLWEYNIEVSKEAVDAGFNEIQFDYVRFPASDGGKLDKFLDYRNETGESKPATIQNYLKYAREQLSPKKAYISADVYGLVGSVEDDMSLGQYWEAISNTVDYICPMMYPSHYANNTYGIPVPDANPYGTIFHSAKDSTTKNRNLKTPAIIRPWIQDFTAPWVKGYIKYGEKQVAEQIKALEENGVDEFMLWNPSNRYSEAAVLR